MRIIKNIFKSKNKKAMIRDLERYVSMEYRLEDRYSALERLKREAGI